LSKAKPRYALETSLDPMLLSLPRTSPAMPACEKAREYRRRSPDSIRGVFLRFPHFQRGAPYTTRPKQINLVLQRLLGRSTKLAPIPRKSSHIARRPEERGLYSFVSRHRQDQAQGPVRRLTPPLHVDQDDRVIYLSPPSQDSILGVPLLH